jgi:hypothetical protein
MRIQVWPFVLAQVYTFESGRTIYDSWIINEFESFREYYKQSNFIRFLFKDTFSITEDPESLPPIDVWEDFGDSLTDPQINNLVNFLLSYTMYIGNSETFANLIMPVDIQNNFYFDLKLFDSKD